MKLEASLIFGCTSFTFGVKLKRYSDLEGCVLLTVMHRSGGSFTFSGIVSLMLDRSFVWEYVDSCVLSNNL